MLKQNLLSFIDKYNLNGLMESVRWNMSKDKLSVDFILPTGDLIGNVISTVDLGEGEIGIYDTSQLYKLINVMDEVKFKLEGNNGNYSKIKLTNNNLKIDYALANVLLMDTAPEVQEPGNYDGEFVFTKEFIDFYIRCKKALGPDSNKVGLGLTYSDDGSGKKVIAVNLGDANDFSHKVKFEFDCGFEGIPSDMLYFDSNVLKEVLVANMDCKSGCIQISNEGLMKLSFTNEDGSCLSTYYYVAKSGN